LTAIDKYDSSRSDNFSFFASQYIGNEIAELFNACCGICRVPRKVMALYNEEKKDKPSTILSNGMRVDDIEKLLHYTGLQNAQQ